MTAEPTAITVRDEQHPLVAQIDAKMPEIAGMLPDGMRPDRFRKVVVQALLRNPDLWACTPISVVTAITEAAEVGIEPTGVLGKGWLLPYKNEAKLVIGWRGFVDLFWRADRLLVTPELVREGDEFDYRRGTGAYLHHVPNFSDPNRERTHDNITFAYVLVRFPDGREEFEVMSRADIERIRDRARFKNPVWTSDFGEMAKKTPIRRIAKRLPLSPAVQRVLGSEEAIDFDVRPIEVAPRAEVASGIAARRKALTSGPSEAPAGAVSAGEGASVAPSPDPAKGVGCSHESTSATPEGVKCNRCAQLIASYDGDVPDEPKPAPRGRRKAVAAKKPGDEGYGTARAHAVAAERGLDHDAVHRIAADVIFGQAVVPDDFSVKDLAEDGWQRVIEAISEAPIGIGLDDAGVAEQFAGRMALQAGLGEGDNPWPEAEPAAADMFGVAEIDGLTPAQWIEFGIRTYARNPLP